LFLSHIGFINFQTFALELCIIGVVLLEEFPGNRVTYVDGGQEEAGRGHDKKAQADHFHVAGGWFNW